MKAIAAVYRERPSTHPDSIMPYRTMEVDMPIDIDQALEFDGSHLPFVELGKVFWVGFRFGEVIVAERCCVTPRSMVTMLGNLRIERGA